MKPLLLTAVLCLAGTMFVSAQTTQPTSSYPLTKCVVSDEALPEVGQRLVETIDGREVHFCCSSCATDFKKDLPASHKKMDEQVIAALKPTYPLKTCPIGNEELGSMGEPVQYVHRPTNQLVQFCCASCVKKFEKDPAPTLAKINAAMAH